MDSLSDLRSEISLTLEECGITVECHHHEVATAGQCEIDFRFSTLLGTADNLQLFKYVVRNIAHQYGKTATFMPKPLYGDNGSGMHCHQSLWKDEKPLFAGDGYAGLSEMASFYIGGLLEARGGGRRLCRADDEQLQASRSRLRGAGESRLLGAQPLGRHPHPDVLDQPEAQAA